MNTLSLVLLILALACFVIEAVQSRSLLAAGLAFWVATQVFSSGMVG